MRRLGSDADRIFTYDDFQGQLKKYGKYAFVLAPVEVQYFLSDPNTLPDFDEASEKMSKEDVDMLSAKFNEETQRVYAQNVNDLLEDLVDLGYWN